MKNFDIKKVLIIAGSDCSGGAGIQADLKTVTSFGVYGMTVITSLTSQNTLGVNKIHDVSFDFIESQLDACLSDLGVDAIKIGMVHKSEIFDLIYKKLLEYKLIDKNCIKIVLDPVMFAKGGHSLLESKAVDSLIDFISKVKPIITPNIPEAEILSGIKIKNKKNMVQAVHEIRKIGANDIILKGGHLSSNNLVDIVFCKSGLIEFKSKKLNTKHTHGTGCTLSSALAANLSKSNDLIKSMAISHEYVFQAIKNAPEFGSGHGPINHMINII